MVVAKILQEALRSVLLGENLLVFSLFTNDIQYLIIRDFMLFNNFSMPYILHN